MEIKLNSLILENFKAITKFQFNPLGKDAEIRANNRKGKTSVADGFRDLLFGKNTKGETDFARQPLDKDGKKIHHLETLLEGIITIDGTNVRLKKVFKETWLKRKNILTGHTTDYWIDGNPVQKKKWDLRMADLIDEEVFKIVTLPEYFTSKNLKDKDCKTKPSWMVRREILFNLPSNKLTDEQVINSDPKLVGLPEILGGKSPDDHKAAVKESIKLAKKAQEQIEPGIKELLRTEPEKKNRTATQAYIKHLDHQIEAKKDDRELAGLRKELANAEAELIEAQTAERKKGAAQEEEANEKARTLKRQIKDLKGRIEDFNSSMKDAHDSIKRKDKRMDDLRHQFTHLTAQESPHREICPTCSQSLPQDQINEARDRYANDMAEKLKAINGEGKALKEENNLGIESLHDTQIKIDGMKDDLKDAEDHLDLMETEGEVVDAEIPKHIGKLKTRVNALGDKIKDRPKTDTTALEAERREEQAKLGKLDAWDDTKARINELKQQEKDLGAKIEDLERQLSIMNTFVVTKAHALEAEINSCFEIVKWKLFNILMNGEVEECCVPMVNGSTELSNSEEINVGLDSIKTLSKHYNFWAPVWIDEAQSITAPLKIPSQTIKLIVDPKFKEMEVSCE